MKAPWSEKSLLVGERRKKIAPWGGKKRGVVGAKEKCKSLVGKIRSAGKRERVSAGKKGEDKSARGGEREKGKAQGGFDRHKQLLIEEEGGGPPNPWKGKKKDRNLSWEKAVPFLT